MKKYKIMYALSIFMLCGFIVMLVFDYLNYDPITTSAPFYVNIIIRLPEFVFPGIVFFCIGYILKKKIN